MNGGGKLAAEWRDRCLEGAMEVGHAVIALPNYQLLARESSPVSEEGRGRKQAVLVFTVRLYHWISTLWY